MQSAFGIEHGSISKADEKATDTVDDVLTPVLPGSTVRAYDNSRRNKRKAATQNFALKTGGAALGATGGTILAIKTKGKIKFLNQPSMFKKTPITPHMKQGYFSAAAGSMGGGAAGGTAGNLSLHQIKNDPEYKYKER